MITIKQGDTYPPLRAYLQMVTGKAIRLNGATVKLIVRDPLSIPKINKPVDIIDADNGYVEYRWETADTNQYGEFRGEFEITQQDGSIVTVPNDGYFTINISDELG